jgi:hypothetical protein
MGQRTGKWWLKGIVDGLGIERRSVHGAQDSTAEELLNGVGYL